MGNERYNRPKLHERGRRKKTQVRRICLVAVVLLTCLTFSLSIYALTNEEKLELLEEKYLKGEIPTNLYLELRDKYTGKSPEAKKEAVSGDIAFKEDFETDIPNWITTRGFKPDQCGANCYDWIAVGILYAPNNKTYRLKSGAKYEGGDTNPLKMGILEGGARGSKRAYEMRRDAPKGDMYAAIVTAAFEVEAGKSYVLSLDSKHSHDLRKLGHYKLPASVVVFWYDDNGNLILKTPIRKFDGPNEQWHVDSSPTLPAPTGVVKARIMLGIEVPDLLNGKYWRMDNITFSTKGGTSREKVFTRKGRANSERRF